MEWSIANATEELIFSAAEDSFTVKFNSGANAITARLACRLLFYKDERNNMDPFGLTDRLTFEAKHFRSPINFFLTPQHTDVLHSRTGDTQSVTFIQRIEEFEASLTFLARAGDPYFSSDLRIQNIGEQTAHLMVVRTGFEAISINGESAREWTSAPESYKNQCFSRGLISDIPEYDLRLVTPPCGTVLPVIYVGEPKADGCALEFSPWLENYGAIILSSKADLCHTTFVDRFMEPGEEHHLGTALLRTLTEGWRRGLSGFKKSVPARFGYHVSANIPEWAHDFRPFTFPKRFAPIGDESWMDYFRWAKERGFNGTMGFGWMWKRYNDIICAIEPENGDLALDAEHGATPESVKRHNEMLHSLGMKSVVWTPTTGASAYASIVREHPEWFVRDEEGNPRSSWLDANGEPWLVDSNPFSEGYHRYWLNLILRLAEWGFDGAFLDGVIARPSDAFSYPYPGKVHNAMYVMIKRLRRELDAAGLKDFLIKPESGDVMLIPGSYWMNMPRLNLKQALPPSRTMPPELLETPRYFLSDECPTIDESQITEHLELIARSWPDGMPGNWGITMEPPEKLTRHSLARIGINYLFGSVVGMGLEQAHDDPDFVHFNGTPDNALPPKQAELRRECFRLISHYNHLRQENPVLARAPRDFDSVSSSNAAMPAFIRCDGKTVVLVVANLSTSPGKTTVRLTAESENLPLPQQNTFTVCELVGGEKTTLSKEKLLNGLELNLDVGELIAWKFPNA